MTEGIHNTYAPKRFIFRIYILNNSSTNQKENNQQPNWKSKVSKRSEHIIYRGGYPNGQWACRKILNIFSHQGNRNSNHSEKPVQSLQKTLNLKDGQH